MNATKKMNLSIALRVLLYSLDGDGIRLHLGHHPNRHVHHLGDLSIKKNFKKIKLKKSSN